MAYDLIKISALPEATPDESQDIVVGVGDYAKRINYGAVKEDMVGTSSTYTTDTEPYLMRQTAHVGVVGKCALNKLVGGSLGWNQLIDESSYAASLHGLTWSLDSHVVTITGTTTAGSNFYFSSQGAGAELVAGRRYMLLGITGLNSPVALRVYHSDTGIIEQIDSDNAMLITPSISKQYAIFINFPISGIQVNIKAVPQLFDLTQMFGSTIADYIYSLETATAGAGIAKLKSWGIDLDTYHAYDAGSIQSVEATAHVTTGFNLIGNLVAGQAINKNTGETMNNTAFARTDYIRVFPNMTYYYKEDYNSFEWAAFYDANKNYVSGLNVYPSSTFTVPDGVAYFRTSIQIANINNVCLSFSGSRNGEYEPYTAHTYSLGSDTLRGFPQLVNNELAYDGDEKLPDGTITRKYEYVDLGSLAWNYISGITYPRFAATPSVSAKPVSNSSVAKIVCARWAVASVTSGTSGTVTNCIGINDQGAIVVHTNDYTSASAFTSAMSGKYLVYEKQTPTTESSTPYQRIQTVDADGTESFTTSTPVPVGHETQTPDNILAALGWLGE